MLNIDLYTYSIDIEKGVVFNTECGFFHHQETTGYFNKKQENYIRECFFEKRHICIIKKYHLLKIRYFNI